MALVEWTIWFSLVPAMVGRASGCFPDVWRDVFLKSCWRKTNYHMKGLQCHRSEGDWHSLSVFNPFFSLVCAWRSGRFCWSRRLLCTEPVALHVTFWCHQIDLSSLCTSSPVMPLITSSLGDATETDEFGICIWLGFFVVVILISSRSLPWWG